MRVFIELTDSEGDRVLIEISSVILVEDLEKSALQGAAAVHYGTDGMLLVRETYDEVKRLLSATGNAMIKKETH